MPQQPPQTFNHFALVRFTDAYWRAPAPERQRTHRGWLGDVKAASGVLHVYQTFPAESGTDLLVWCAVAGSEPDLPARFFAQFAAATAPYRSQVEVRESLWGFTRPSQYTKTRSAQEMDPFARERRPYLIMYPFVKTAEWYLKDQEERRRMMAQHMKVGKQYGDIAQLLLYSFGLQDQEFVVVYETDDLIRFLNLVTDLRGTEARLYTQRDFPLHTAMHQPSIEALAQWL